MGSGSLHAMTIIESKFKDDLSREEAIALVIEAITAGIYHDLGSGSNVDYLVITKEKSDMFRNAVLNKDLHEISL
jgi:20S proteasome subunit beta 2